MATPHDDPSKWPAIGAIAAAATALFAYLKALYWRKREMKAEPLPAERLTLKALDKRIKDHDSRLDDIDLKLAEDGRTRDDQHVKVMRELKLIRAGLKIE
jgi:hypothetical protein